MYVKVWYIKSIKCIYNVDACEDGKSPWQPNYYHTTALDMVSE